MKCTLKRFLSLALALVMTLSMLPNLGHVHVHAEEVETVSTEPVPDYESEEVTEPVPDDETTEPSQEDEASTEPVPVDEATNPSQDDEASIEPVAEEIQPLAENTLTTINGLTATWTDASASSGKASWSASGITITGQATGYKSMGILSRSITTKLTLTNTSGGEAKLKFNYTLTGGGSVSGISGNAYEGVLANNASITITLTSPSGVSTNTLNITGLSLISTSAADVTTTFKPATAGGSYTLGGVAVTETTPKTEAAGTEYTLVATPASGYAFFGWYEEATGTYLDYNASYTYTASAEATIVPKFVSSQTALFGVGAVQFDNLTDACNFANSSAASTKTVVLLNNGTVTGSHTIPAGVTLLIPFNDNNTLYTTKPACTSYSSYINANGNIKWVQPTAYRTLTMAADARITVNGAMSLSAQHAAANGGANYCGSPTGPVSFVNMQSGSNITVNSGGNLYAWGFITGSGSVTANSGATVYENFQITDFRGGSATMSYAGNGLAFPLNQYYVQNIEVPVTFYAGSSEKIYTSAFSSNQCLGGEATFIGAGGMFTSSAGGYVVKDFDESRDRLNVDLYGNCELNSMTVELSIEVNSANYLLPITNNVSIGIHSGVTTLKQSVALLPGVEVTVDQGATLNLAYSGTGINDFCTDGYNIIVYDRDEWLYGINMETGETATGVKYGNVLHTSAPVPNGYSAKPAYFVPVLYAPGRTGGRTDADLVDAVLDINGTLYADGYIYTTMGGAAIISSEKTGKIEMVHGSGADVLTCQNNGTTSITLAFMIYSAWLQNGDGSYLQTATYDEETGEVISSTAPNTTFAYCETHDHWYTGECEDCAAAPTEYTITWQINGATHTTTKVVAGAPITAPSYTAPEGYDFSGWNYPETMPEGDQTYNATQTIKTFQITWIINGTETTQDFDWNTVPEFKGDITLPNSPYACYRYAFAGWSTEANGGGTTYPDGKELPAATANVTYYAYYTETIKHTPSDDDGDCTTAILCSACKAVTTEGAAAHTPEADDGDCTTAVKCVNCEKNAVEAKDAHVAGEDDGDCTTAVKCVNCDKNAVEAKSHDYKITGYDEYYSYHTAHYACENDGCNATKVESDVPHDYTYDPVNHKCVCGKVEIFSTVIDFNGFVYDGRTEYATTNSYGSDIMYFLEAWGKNMSKREGYNFLGWTTVKDDASTLIGTESYIVTEARTLYALWETTSYTITLMVDDKQYGDVLTFAYGAEITGLPTPEKAANGCTTYTFSGWQEEVPEIMPAENLILHATFTTEISHTAGEPVIENEVAATCGADGSYDTVVYCSVCDEELSRETIPVPATGEHGWKLTEYVWDWVEKPEDVTCTANAACQTCGATTSADAVMTVEKTDDAWCYMPASYEWTAEFHVEWAETQTHACPYGSERDPNRHGTTTNLVKIDEDTHQAFCYYCQTYLGEPAPHDQKTVNFAGNCNLEASYTCSCGYNYYGEVNPDVHAAGSILAYTDITDDQHTAYHPCCDAKEEPAPHDYATGTSAHTCACGAVEKFTITWTVNGEVYTTTDVKYGATITAPTYTAPTGYAFPGWDVPATMPAEDITLDATLEPNTYYIEAYDAEGEIAEEWYALYGDVITADDLPELELEGHSHVGWLVNGEEATFPVTVTGDMRFEPIFEVNTYTIRWDTNGDGTVDDTTSVEYGTVPTHADGSKNATAKYTYTFTGWKDTEGNAPVAVTGEATYTAQFTETANTYKITYKVNDEQVYEESYAYGAAVTAWVYTPEEGYIFSDWDAVPVTMPAHNVEVNGTTTIKTYTVTWKNPDGTDLAYTTVEYGKVPAFPAGQTPLYPDTMAEEGYDYAHVGWSEELYGEMLDSIPAATGDNTYYAVYSKTAKNYLVTWTVDGEWYKDTTVAYGAAITAPEAPTKEGHTFSGWDIPETMPAQNITLDATLEPNTYYIEVYDAEGEIAGEWYALYCDVITADDLPELELEGHSHVGWLVNGEEATFPVTVTGDMRFEPIFEVNTYTLTLLMAEEDADTYYEQTFKFGEAIPDIADPERRGYTFEGWSDDIPTTMPGRNVTIYANWSDPISYSIKWFVNNELYKQEYSACDRNIYAPEYEVPEGYTFSGWINEEGEVIDWFFMPDRDVEIHATLTVNTYTITWKIGDQTWTTNPTHGQAIDEPDVTVPDKYYGYGWTTEIPETASGDLTIEGYWTAKLMVLDEDGNEMQFTSGGLSYYPQWKIANVGETAYANYRGTNYKVGHTLYLVNVADETEKYEITYESGATVYPSVPMTENKTLKLTAVPKTYTITLMVDGVQYGEVLEFAFNEAIALPVPTKAQSGCTTYTFSGWNETVPETMPAENLTFTGSFTESTNHNWQISGYTNDGETHTVHYACENSDCNATKSESGKNHDYNSGTSAYTCICGDVKQFTVYWRDSNGNELGESLVDYGAPLPTCPYTPTIPEGYYGIGWCDEWSGDDAPETMPAGNLYLQYFISKIQYNVTFLYENGDTWKYVTYYHGDEIKDLAEDNPYPDTKEGHSFIGWGVKDAETGKIELVTTMTATGNLILYPVFEVNTYTVTWKINGEVYSTNDVAYGAAITAPVYTVPEGHTFSGWDVPATMPAENITLDATLTVNTYALTVNILMAQHGVEGPAKQVVLTVPYGSKLLEVLAQAEAEGKIPANGQKYRLKTAGENGEVWNWGYLYDNGEWDDWVFEGLTMPAGDFAVDQTYGFNGWMIDEVGSEYWLESDEFSGIIQGWNYIEEDYDDVDGGAWYYFALSTLEEWVGRAFRAEDITLTTKDGVEGYYAFDHETGKWLENYTGIYTAVSGDVYYVENGIAVADKGLVRVYENGEAKYYYFGCSVTDKDGHDDNSCDAYKAQRNTVHWVENTNGYDLPEWDYTFGDDGVIVHDDELNGFEEQHHKVAAYADGKYYTIDGVKAHWGLFIGDGKLLGEEGAYYYARSSGALVVSRDYWISASHLNGVVRNGEPVEEGSYTFDAEGRIVWSVDVKNGIYAEDGKMFYYVDGERNYAGLIQYTGTSDNGIAYNNDWIYVRTNGQLATGKYWTTKHNDNMKAATYDFDEYGRMNQFTGIKDGYYYKNGVINYAGLIEIDGAYYYVKTNGEVVKNRNYWITKTNGLMPEKSYNFDADGKITNPVLKDETKEGIVEVDGKLFYYKDGAPCYAGLIQIDGNWYYVKTSGELATGKYWITKTNGYMKQGSYTFDENGVMQNPAL